MVLAQTLDGLNQEPMKLNKIARACSSQFYQSCNFVDQYISSHLHYIGFTCFFTSCFEGVGYRDPMRNKTLFFKKKNNYFTPNLGALLI